METQPLPRHRVYSDGRYSRCVVPGSAEERDCLNDGYAPAFDWDGDRFSGWTKAMVEFGLFAEDYDDRMTPVALSVPTALYRSVSRDELHDILERGAVMGGGNGFNDFDPRGFVFFSPAVTERVIGQGEEIERAAAHAAGKSVDRSLPFDQAREAFLAAFGQARAALAARLAEADWTSAVIRTVPLTDALHYSHEHGRSGMGMEDEFGFFPGQVRIGDIDEVSFVRRGEIVETVSAAEAWERLSGGPAGPRP